jgi:hypothetical protein
MKKRLHYKILLAGANRTLKHAGLAWRMTSLTLTVVLTYAPIAHIIIKGLFLWFD